MKDDRLLSAEDEQLLTIGALVEALRPDFPDISVSKVRYLEEQGLVTPKRTKSGYRKFSQDDVNRLVRALAMQRDEYLPLKVIRRELERNPASAVPSTRQVLSQSTLLAGGQREYTADEIQELTGADLALLTELEEYELVHARHTGGVRYYAEQDVGVVGAATQLAQLGLRPKNLRLFKSGVDRELGLIEQVMLPALKSSRSERRRQGLEQIEEIVQATTQLRQLLLARGLRKLTENPT